MSANLELVRSIFADWKRGDFSSTDWAHPEIEYVFTDGPAPGTWTGLAGMEEASRDWVSAWEDWHAEAEEYRELDDERVLVLYRFGNATKGAKLSSRARARLRRGGRLGRRPRTRGSRSRRRRRRRRRRRCTA